MRLSHRSVIANQHNLLLRARRLPHQQRPDDPQTVTPRDRAAVPHRRRDRDRHAGRRRRAAGVPPRSLRPRRGPRAHRAGGRHQLGRRADDGQAGARPPGLRASRPVQPALVPARWRAGPRRPARPAAREAPPRVGRAGQDLRAERVGRLPHPRPGRRPRRPPRDRRSPVPGRGDPDRRSRRHGRRRDPGALADGDAGLRRRSTTARSTTTAGCTPATSAASRTGTCSSPDGRRTS